MNKRLLYMAVAFATGIVCALPASSQVRPETQLKQRQGAMSLQGKYFYPIRAQAQGKTPYNADIVTRNVHYLEVLSKVPWDAFTPATKDLKSQAMPAVFSEPAKFKEAQDRFQAEITRLVDLTRKGDEAAIRAQILAVDKSCNACHDNFRERQ